MKVRVANGFTVVTGSGGSVACTWKQPCNQRGPHTTSPHKHRKTVVRKICSSSDEQFTFPFHSSGEKNTTVTPGSLSALSYMHLMLSSQESCKSLHSHFRRGETDFQMIENLLRSHSSDKAMTQPGLQHAAPPFAGLGNR